MRILMVSGPVHYSYCLCRALSEAGAAVRLLAPTVFDVVHDYPIPFEVRKPFQWGGYLRHLRAILEEAREFKPDVVHVQWTLAPRKDWIAAQWLPRLGAPAVLTVHNVLPHEPAFGERWALRRLYSRFQALWVHSESTRADLAALDVPPERVTVIPHGNFTFIRERYGMADRGAARRRLGLAPAAPVALFFGGLRAYKGLEVLLDGFALVRERMPGARLILAGHPFGDAARRCAEAVRARGLAASVLLRAEFIPDAEIPVLFGAADVVVLPYLTGTYSGVVHLAYAFERPVVTTRVGAVGATVEEDGTGLAVPPGDAAALAEACAALLSDGPRREACVGRIRVLAREKYDWGKIAAQAIEWYGKLM